MLWIGIEPTTSQAPLGSSLYPTLLSFFCVLFFVLFLFLFLQVSTEIRYNSSNAKFKEDLRIPCMVSHDW